MGGSSLENKKCLHLCVSANCISEHLRMCFFSSPFHVVLTSARIGEYEVGELQTRLWLDSPGKCRKWRRELRRGDSSLIHWQSQRKTMRVFARWITNLHFCNLFLSLGQETRNNFLGSSLVLICRDISRCLFHFFFFVRNKGSLTSNNHVISGAPADTQPSSKHIHALQVRNYWNHPV